MMMLDEEIYFSSRRIKSTQLILKVIHGNFAQEQVNHRSHGTNTDWFNEHESGILTMVLRTATFRARVFWSLSLLKLWCYGGWMARQD